MAALLLINPLPRQAVTTQRGQNWWPSPLPTDDRLYTLDVRADLGMCFPPCGSIAPAVTVYVNGEQPDPPPQPSDRIIYATMAIQPSGDGELYALGFAYADGVFTCELTGGQPGRVYLVQISGKGASGLSYAWAINMEVSRTGALPPFGPPAPSPGPGYVFVWPVGATMYGPVLNLPPVTVVAGGTNQLTATPVTLARVLVTSGSGGGILLPQASNFNGAQMSVANRSGGVITIYPYAGDAIESNAPNAGMTLQNQSNVSFYVTNSGLLIATS